MCDLSPEVRRGRYLLLRSVGYTRGWALRARDFTNTRFINAMINGRAKSQYKRIKRLIKESSIDVLPDNFASKVYIRPIRESKQKKD
jgi:hypothetical protein